MEKYLNAALPAKERAEDLLSKMSLDEKIRQLGCTMVIGIMPSEYQDLRGGIGSATLMMTPGKYNEELRKYQEYIIQNSPHGIPALFHGEALTGPMSLPGASQYPISIGLGAAFDPELVTGMCEISRKQLVANGIRHALSPVADLARDLRWGRCNETYGNDPTLSAVLTTAFVKSLQGEELTEGVAACGKHFLGYSETEGGMNMHKNMGNAQDTRERFAKPFEAAINLADLKTVMNAYSAIDGKPIIGDKKILRDLLRDELGFKGVTVSDYSAIPQLMDTYKVAESTLDAGVQALKAGMDVEMPSLSCYKNLADAVAEGDLDEATIDEAVLRVLTLKFELGLFENPYPHDDKIDAVMDGTVPNRKSYEAALETMTLLKNDGILPLPKEKSVAVIGPTGNCMRLMYSHYTAIANTEMMMLLGAEGDTQQGFNMTELMDGDAAAEMEAANSNVTQYDMGGAEFADKHMLDGMIRQLYPDAKTIFEAILDKAAKAGFAEGCDYKGDDATGFDAAVELAKASDVVVLCVGGKSGLGRHATTGEGIDNASLDLPGLQEELMRVVYAANPNMVIVHTDCRPLVSVWAYENVPAILEAWLPSTFGGNAIAEVLFGDYNPGGKTPVDVPRSAGHTPVYHYQNNGSSATRNLGLVGKGYTGDSSDVLRPFGFGLSYTSFAYRDIEMRDLGDGELEIVVSVQNVGIYKQILLKVAKTSGMSWQLLEKKFVFAKTKRCLIPICLLLF